MRTAVIFSLTLVAGLLAPAFGPTSAHGAEAPYVGTKKCKMCHLKEWQSWSETKMAKSFELLKPGVAVEAKTKAKLDPAKDYTRDGECLACHTTGYGKPGGFVSFETSPDLAGVGCEMCHGAGGTYTQSGYMTLQNKEYKKTDVVAAGLTGTISKENCSVCHNEKSPFVGPGYVFDFEARKTKGTHEKLALKYQH